VSDLELFFDPVCPWAWITSRWVVDVQRQRSYEVSWRFISLRMLNEQQTADWYTPEYRAGHAAGTQALRVAAAIRAADGNEAVGRFYTALGERLHPGGRGRELIEQPRALLGESCAAAGVDPSLADACDDDTHDTLIRAETELALERTGRDVGTPILTFHPGQPDEGSYFGPVIARAPKGAEALRLWDAIEALATTSGVAELKRSLRGRLRFD
jgi:hypothetical protein